MKKIISLLLVGLFVLGGMTACAGESDARRTDTDLSKNERTAENRPIDDRNVSAERRLKMTVNGEVISIILQDTPTANALYAALPMELRFSDYSGLEKIAYPPDALPTAGESDGCTPTVGDLCLFVPWGNLCIFYTPQDFHHSKSLIKLGHVESGMEILSGMNGDFTVTLEKAD